VRKALLCEERAFSKKNKKKITVGVGDEAGLEKLKKNSKQRELAPLIRAGGGASG
jgi:hypothetical protein